jgi:hypothetical protein
MKFHHTIPISLLWENKEDNWFYLSTQEHKELHNTQNVPYKYIRTFRARTNHILIPDNYSFNEKCKLWKIYFYNPYTKPEEQLKNLNLQSERYCNKNWNIFEKQNNFSDAIDNLIENQRIYVSNLLKTL